MNRLSTKLVVTQITFLLVALVSIGLTLFVSWQLEGSAAAINDAGSLRMRSYRLAYLAAQAQSVGGRAAWSALARHDIDEFERVLAGLRRGDPRRPLFLPRSAEVEAQFARLDIEWRKLKPVFAATNDSPSPDRDRVERFVAVVNGLVAAVEAAVAQSTSLLRMTQFGLVALAIAGTVALLYLSFLFIIRPVSRLQEGIERMAQADFSVRLPVDTRDEFGQLATGFNSMADRLQDLYHNLETRVARKTESLAEQNRRLATLYDMAAFINAPHALEDLARGFVHRLVTSLGASAGTVRLATPDADATQIYVAEGLDPAFVETERCVRRGECACGDTTENHRGVVYRLDERRLAVALPHCRNAGFATVAAFPIAAQRQTIGVFNLFFREPREIGIEERHMLETLGQHLGVAIEHLRLVSRDKELAVTQERNLLAQELHDSIAQALAFLNLQAQMLRDSLRKSRWGEARTAAGEIQTGVQECYADVRELLTHFRTRVDHADLEQALRTMIAKFRQQTGIETTLTVSGSGVAPPSDALPQVVHIVHEALSNVRKHAGASRVDVEMRRGPVYRLTVRDDGCGFDPRAPAVEGEETGHVGLRIMRERAGRVGATVTVASRPGGGTEVAVLLPVAREEAAA